MYEQRLREYFESIIVPLVADCSQEMADRMTIYVAGSYALGSADEQSDLDCFLYVPDELYERHFAEVQLKRIHHLPLARRFNPPTQPPRRNVSGTAVGAPCQPLSREQERSSMGG